MPTLFEAPTPNKKSATASPKKRPHDHSFMGPLTCFAVNPDGVRFETQEDEERVVLFLRQHLIVNVPWVVLTIVLVFAPSVVFPFFFTFVKLPFALPVGYILVGTLFWYLMAFGFALTHFLGWFFNIYIVTNERLVDIDFVHLLYKEFSEARLSKIQDLTYKTGGILAAFFNYGDVFIQTAGELPNFEFHSVPHPDRVVQTIGELAEGVKNSNI